MASSLLALGDLINFQLERLKLDEFVYEDELQLQRKLHDLDADYRQLQQRRLERDERDHRKQEEKKQKQKQNQKLAKQSKSKRNKANGNGNGQANGTSSTSPSITSPPNGGTGLQAAAAVAKRSATTKLPRPASLYTQSSDGNSAELTPLVRRMTSVGLSEAVVPYDGASDGDDTPPQRQLYPIAPSRIIFPCRGTFDPSSSATGDDGGDTTMANGGMEGGSEENGGDFGDFDTDNNSAASTFDETTDFKSLVLSWFHQLLVLTSGFKSDEESRRLREAGNDSYRKERHPLKASDLYTEAIFRAPAENTLAAAMAHANRSTVLHDYGMFEASYDDCLCALDLGYPEEYCALIKLRQVSCALKMRDFELCEHHLHELLHMELSEAFEIRINELWQECEVQKATRFEMGVQTADDLPRNGVKTYEVVWDDDCPESEVSTKASYLRTTQAISENEMVLQDEAFVFASSTESRICDNCGVTQFVPIPCIECSCRTAIYCSRKCRAEHAHIHSVECFAHKIELFDEIGVEFTMPRLVQLALRMFITGLPQVMPHCRKKPTVPKMWQAFNGVLGERTDIPYSALLRLEAHPQKDALESLVTCAVIANVMAIYLSECTDFFERITETIPVASKLTNDDWELLTAALLLRHMHQLRHKNLIHCQNFVLPLDQKILSPANEFTIWASLKRVHRGRLHLLAGDVSTVAYAIFPGTFSLCRQSCEDMLYACCSGRKLKVFAACDIPSGQTIVNSFVDTNYRQSLREYRHSELHLKGMECTCVKCVRPQPDEDFHKFHRYRCDNPNCMQIFTPKSLKSTNNLQWWNSDYYVQPENNGSEHLVCSICEETQKLDWFWQFRAALSDCDTVEKRCKLYGAVEAADQQLIDMHACKIALARQIIEHCLCLYREDATLDAWEFNKMGSMMRTVLPIVAAMYRVFSIEYVQHMTYFWDIMALSDYKCSDKELIYMLTALDYIPEEFKEVFINYYDDYIAPKYAENEYQHVGDTEV